MICASRFLHGFFPPIEWGFDLSVYSLPTKFGAGLFFTPHMTLESVSRRLNSSQSWQPGKTLAWPYNNITLPPGAQWKWFFWYHRWVCRLPFGLVQRASLYDLLLHVIILLLCTEYGICTWNCVYYGVLDAVKCIMMTTMYFANIIERTPAIMNVAYSIAF